MSRVGKMPIILPEGTTFRRDGNIINVSGPKGELSMRIHNEMDTNLDKSQINVERPSDSKNHRSLHGLYRSLIANLIEGVTKGFEKKLEIRGVGYRAEMKGRLLHLQLGYSHPIIFSPPEGVVISCENQTSIKINAIDKEVLGHVAAKIRSFRKPEPYKGKGIRYVGEYVREKAGKTAGS